MYTKKEYDHSANNIFFQRKNQLEINQSLGMGYYMLAVKKIIFLLVRKQIICKFAALSFELKKYM
jgi:hypothetical protein